MHNKNVKKRKTMKFEEFKNTIKKGQKKGIKAKGENPIASKHFGGPKSGDKAVATLENLDEAATLFGDMGDFKKNFLAMDGFVFSKESENSANVPAASTLPSVDFKNNWKKHGWSYTTHRGYCTEVNNSRDNKLDLSTSAKFESVDELAAFVEKAVMGDGWKKKGWVATKLTKPEKREYNKDSRNDRAIAYQHPALGIIAFDFLDSTLRRRNWDRDKIEYRFQVIASFMNDKAYFGEISKAGDGELKSAVDAFMDGKNEKEAKAIMDYIKTKFNINTF